MTARASAGARAALGAVLWVGLLAWLRPAPGAEDWAACLLCLVPLVLAPLAFARLAADAPLPPSFAGGCAEVGQAPAAAALALACAQPAGALAALLALPWLFVCSSRALQGLLDLSARPWLSLPRISIAAAQLFLVLGAGWTLVDRLGLRPLGFAGAIVQLTGAHFHFAGFALLLCAGWALERAPGRLARAAALTVLCGVPLVAAGITAAQLGRGQGLEAIAACVLALGGALVGAVHLGLACRPEQAPLVRGLFFLSGSALVAGMLLAAAYGLRAHAPVLDGLDLAPMRAWHGSANALGFALPCVLGWWRWEPRPRPASSR